MIENLKQLSATLGSNPYWVQAAGGNTSLKEQDTLWIKASGKWLAHALKEDIFLPVKLGAIRAAIKAQEADPVSAHMLINTELKPSIETTLHALLPHKFVAHLHAVSTIPWSVLNNAQNELQARLSGLNWAWVPYCKPGLALTQAMAATHSQEPDVIILANHGLVLGAEDCTGISSLLKEVDERLYIPGRTLCTTQAPLAGLAEETGMKLPKHCAIHSLALDPISFDIALNGVLYPDHPVFLGAFPERVHQGDCPIKHITAYKAKTGSLPLYLLIENQGVLVSPSISQSAQDMLLCQALVVARLPDHKAVSYLPEKDVQALLNWDAERYRQNLMK